MPDSAAAVVAPRGGLADAVVRFCRLLRQRGLLVSPAETLDAVRTLELIDLGDRRELHLALRALATTKPTELALFDAVFDEFWPRGAPPAREGIPRPHVRAPNSVPPRPLPSRTQHPAAVTLARWVRAAAGMPEDATVLRLPSAVDARTQLPVATFDSDTMEDAVRVARRLARRLASRPGRRWEPSARGPRLHLRRTVRSALRTAGDLSLLVYRRRKIRRTKLVVLCDVSGSMDVYARQLLQFLFALQHTFARVETFVFATRLSRITTDLRATDYHDALDRVGSHVNDWNGGTRIGASLGAFVADWLRLVDRRTIVMVMSDGWDTGDPSKVAEALATIRQHASRIVWLNPLLGNAEYEPRARGMQAALPYIDLLAPAHDVASLEALAHHLTV